MIHFTIVTQEKEIYREEVSQVTIPTQSGVITVLPHHIPLVTLVNTGEIKLITEDKKEHYLAVSAGMLEVRPNNEVILLADRSELAYEIDIDRAQSSFETAKAAYDRAKVAMDEKREGLDVDFTRLQAIMDKELNRIHIGRRHLERRKN